MSTTSKATPTVEELRERLDEQKREVEAAELALGAAALDTNDPQAASKRVTDAESAAQRTRAALAELERREQDRKRHELELTAARDRHRSYLWAADYLAAIVEVQRLQEQVHAAAARLGRVSQGVPRAVGVVKSPGVGKALAWDLETLDQDLVRSLPNGQMDRFPIRGFKDLPDKGWRAGPDQLEARIASAHKLAEAEAKAIAELERGDQS